MYPVTISGTGTRDKNFPTYGEINGTNKTSVGANGFAHEITDSITICNAQCQGAVLHQTDKLF